MSDATVTQDDLAAAADFCVRTLNPALDRDWSVPAGDLEWDCRRTLDHLVDALLFYSALLATRSTERIRSPRSGDPDATIEQLLTAVPTAAAILNEITKAAPPGTRAFHPAGMADVSGWLAMACTEVLVHTYDIASGLDIDLDPPAAIASRVVARIFPWAPTDAEPWATLLWCAGRTPLGDQPRLDPDWYWHPAPLSEWDGTVKRRTAPPAWR